LATSCKVTPDAGGGEGDSIPPSREELQSHIAKLVMQKEVKTWGPFCKQADKTSFFIAVLNLLPK
jgi:hypothetical protein